MPTRVSVFPVANRGSSKAIDHNGSGLVAYSVRSCIYIFDFRTSPPILIDSMFLPNSHQGRVLSVCFCKSNNKLLASVGEEGTVKIWDLESATCVSSQGVKEMCYCVEWLYDSVNTVVFPDVNGSVSKWNFKTGTVVRMKTSSNSSACVLSSNKSSPELLAVGHIIGSISILNVNSQTLVYKLKTHSMEITSLSWSPISPLMLLSVSMDHSARLWMLGEDKPFKTYYFPTSRQKVDDKKKSKYCGLFHPENPDVIICSNVRGEIGAITFKENEVPKFKPYDVKGSDPYYNYKTVFTMVPYCSETGSHNLFLAVDNTKISLWDAAEEKLLSTYNFSCGSINYLSVSAHNQYLMAICAGDGFLRIWNAEPETKKVDISVIYINIRVKIMCAAWHPTEQNILACGSDEGRVGIVDIRIKKLLYSYEAHHNSTVYSLQWGPCKKLKDSPDEFFLYSVGGGHVNVYELNKPKEKPADFESLITLPPDIEKGARGYTELSWKYDYSSIPTAEQSPNCLAVGSNKGFVDLFDDKLNFLARLTLQMKSIESLRWHPMCTFASTNKSNYSSWLAAAGHDDSIHIFDATDVIKGQSKSILCKPTRTLVGHKKRVSSVCWSPHNDGYLVSAARDGTVQVWNTISGTCIAVYPCHRDLVYTAQWSIFDPDVIYSGGFDNCLRIWNISEQSKTFSAEKFKIVKRKMFKPQRERESDVRRVKFSDENSSQKDSSEVNTIDNETPEESFTENTTEGTKFNAGAKRDSKENQKMKNDTVIFKRQSRNLFPDLTPKFHSKEECVDDIIQLTDLLCDQPENGSENPLYSKVTEEELLKFGFFADQFTALKMLEARANLQNTDGNIEKASCLHMMTCNVEPMLIKAAEKKQLSDFLVASAPTVSYKFWHEMCEKFAMQLVEEQNFMKASMYYLFCGKLQDAIKLLMDKNKFLEALSLARARLPESDPLLHTIYDRAAKYHFGHNQMFVSEASCYLSIKKPLEAAEVLFCVKSTKYIYAATYICRKYNFMEKANDYGYFCMEKCLSQNDWPTFYKVIELVDSLKIYKVLVRVHEVLSMHIKELKKDDDSKLFGMTGSKLLIWEGKTFKGLSFLSHIYEIIRNESILPEDKTDLEEIHKTLDAMIMKRKYEIPAEAHVGVAIYLTQVIITLLLGDLCLATKYFMKIFSTAHNIAVLPKIVHQLFLPLDLYWCSHEDSVVCDSKIKDIEIFPFASYFQNIYVSVCNKFTSIGKSDASDVAFFPCVSPHISSAIQLVLSILSEKTTEDSLFLYFCAFYLNELRRQAKKGWKFRCYITNSKLPESIVHENKIAKNDLENVQESPCSTDSIKQIKEFQNGVEEKPDESIPSSDVVVCRVAATSENENDLNGVEQSLSSSNCVLKQTEECHDGISETTSSNLTNSKVDEILDEAKACALDLVDKILSGENLPVSKNNVDSVGQIMSSTDNPPESIEECQNGPEEKPNENILTNSTDHQSIAIDHSYAITLVCDDNENDHLQCWTDISLFYVVIKYLISVICKDSYALKFYLEKCLNQLDSMIANLARQKSTSAVVKSKSNRVSKEAPSQKCNGQKTEKNSCSSLQETDSQVNVIQHSADSDTMKSELIAVAVDEQKCDTNIVNGSALEEDKVSATVENDSTLKLEVVESAEEESDINVENGNNQVGANGEDEVNLQGEIVLSNDGGDVKLENVVKSIQGISKNDEEISNVDSVTSSDGNVKIENEVNSVHEVSDNGGKTNDDVVEESEVNRNVSSAEVTENGCTRQKADSEGIEFEHEKLSEQIKLLSSKEFCYPNPFDAVLAVHGICCDIYNKHPCKLIKVKFHELAHEVSKWNAKFCTKDETHTCVICHEKVSV